MSPTDLNAALQIALTHHQAGQLAEAEAGYASILEIEPHHLDALHLFAALRLQQGMSKDALTLSEQLIAIAPSISDAHDNRGSALQALGIPAAYVSGYLRTLPPAGGVKLAGADAMHAWVRAWCGAAQGWIEYDPTNATLAGSDHIVVGYGRDYFDVAPVSGHLRSSGGQTNTQAVDVSVVG